MSGIIRPGASPALSAYANAIERARAAAPAAPGGGPAPAFAAVLEQTLRDAVAAGHAGEAAAIDGIAGRIGPQEVAQAVAAAELSLRTVVAVRDRMIAAYQELMRMPI